ncbi:MAG: sigma-70 family RNA polymerase sigma factor [Chitinophagaceae bacterium]|nr:sigma-70 family RNA polymerase sigma factor [Chitinophagaceae bacterium]
MKTYETYGDNQLLDLLSADDGKAFTEIYNRYWRVVFAIAYSRLKDAHLAEDILSDVFTSLWSNRNKSAISSLENYLASAAKYLVFASIRKKAHEERYYATSQLNTEVNAEDDFIYKQLYEFATKEIESLPERCRLIFRYREKGMSNSEIALQMKISIKTVENQINKAFHHLRFAMKKILQVLI